VAGLVLVQLMWAGNNIIARAVVGEIPPFALTFWRWFTACMLVLPFGWPHVRRDWPTIRQNRARLTLLSLLGVGTFNLLQYSAAQTTTAINMTLIHQALPIATIFMAWCLARERPARAHLVGVTVAFAGTLIVVGRGSWHTLWSARFVPGDLLMLIAIALFAAYSVLLKIYALRLHPLALQTVLIAITVPLLAPFYAWEYARGGPFAADAVAILAILYVGIGPSVICYLLWNRAVERLGPAATAASNYLNPVFVVTLAVPLLGERMEYFHWIGGALIIGGVAHALRNGPSGSGPVVAQPSTRPRARM
jgi:drug/metabolite transporter (DMT)-like permease